MVECISGCVKAVCNKASHSHTDKTVLHNDEDALTSRLKYNFIQFQPVRVLLEPVFHYVMVTFVPFCSNILHGDIMLPSTGGGYD